MRVRTVVVYGDQRDVSFICIGHIWGGIFVNSFDPLT